MKVSKRNFKQAISEMFTTEIKFAACCLIKLFEKQYKSKNFELSLNPKIIYEKKIQQIGKMENVIFAISL